MNAESFQSITRFSSLAFQVQIINLCRLMKRAYISFDYDHDSDLKNTSCRAIETFGYRL